MWEVKKIARFLSTRHRILPSCGCKARETMIAKYDPLPPNFFTFLTYLTHHLTVVKVSGKNQCWKIFARASLSNYMLNF